MKKNSTLILWNYLIDRKCKDLDKSIFLENHEFGLTPDQKVIDKVMTYAKSVHSVKTRSGKRILINLN